MRTLRLGVAAGIIAAVAALLPASPASAHTFAGLAAFTGNAQTPGGLWFPVSPFCNSTPVPPPVPPPSPLCPNTSTWTFSSTLDVIISPNTTPTSNPGAGRVGGSGSLTGWCGQSVGSGTTNIEGITVAVVFVTVGGTGVLVNDPLAGPPAGHTAGALVSTFQARPIPAAVGQVPCLTSAAVDFLIVGVGAGAEA